MKKLILLFVLIPCFAFSQNWDKSSPMHFSAGVAIGGVGYEIGKLREENRLLWSVGSATIIGIGKELFDSSQPNNRFDVSDAIYTSLGGGISYLASEYLGINGYIMAGAGIVGLGISINL